MANTITPPNQTVSEVELFLKQNGSFPKISKAEKTSCEAKLRERYDNLTRQKNLEKIKENDPKLFARIMKLEAIKPTRTFSDAERIEQFEIFFRKNGRKPVATRGKVSKDEYNLARAYDKYYSPKGKRRSSVSPELLARLEALEAQPGWKSKTSSSEHFAELVDFCDKNHWFPQRNSPDSKERSLAEAIAQKKRFTQEENAKIKELKKQYGTNSHVSYPEKIFCQVLTRLFGDGVIANRKICGHEADIAFPYKGQYYIVQYDGELYHKKAKNEQNDRNANAAHIAAKNKVLRIRERGLPTLDADNQYNKSIYKEIHIDPRQIKEKETEEVVKEIFDFIDYHKEFSLSEIWPDVIKNARQEASSRKVVISPICEYLEYILLTEGVPNRSSQNGTDVGVRIDGRIKRLYADKRFKEIDLEALAVIEAFYEPTSRKRNQKRFEKIGKALDFSKGSQYVSKKTN